MNQPLRRSSQRGLTLVELMVGIVVSALVGLAALGTARVFNAAQRQGVSSGMTATSLLTTLNGMKLQVSQAGLGFYQDGAYACLNMNLSAGGVKYFDNAQFTPLLATVDVARFDRVGTIYADDALAGSRVLLKSNVTLTDTSAYLDSLVPQSVVGPVSGQTRAVMLAGASGSGLPCTIRTVTAWTAPDPLINRPLRLTMDSTGQHNQMAFSTGVTYVGNSSVMSVLGSLHWWTFRVLDPVTNAAPTAATIDGNLVVEKPMTGESAVLERNVVAFKVQYGLSNSANPGDTAATQWVSPTGVWALLDSAAEIGRVRAIRLGMVVRGELPRDSQAAACEQISTAPILFRDSQTPVTVTPVDTAAARWECYRYRQAEVVIPMRNIVLGRESGLP